MLKPYFKRKLKENLAGYMFMAPLIIGMLVFSLIPIIQSLYYSFFEYNGLMLFNYVGFANYSDIFLRDSEFIKVLLNTFLYAALSVIIGIVTSYLLALIVNKNVKGIFIIRALYYLPCVIPGVVMGAMWGNLMEYPQGAFNTILGFFNIKPFTFMQAASTSMVSLLIMMIWSMGSGMILWLAAFKNIPQTLYEAASIDGAGKIKQFAIITVPMSTPTIFYNVVTSLIGALQVNSTLMIAPRSGKGIDDSLYFIAVKIYREAFLKQNYGYASAIAWILFAVIGILVAIVFSTSKWVYYGED